MNVLCSAKACPVLLSTTCVFYEGENLIYTGINTNDNLQEALQKIDETIGNTFLAFVPLSRTITINGVTQDLSANRTWNVGTVTSITFSGPLTGGTITGSGTVGITKSSASIDGYLSSTDWSIFNGKQNQLNGTGFVKASGTTISYDNSTYVPTSRTLTINGTTFDLSADRTWTVPSNNIYNSDGTLTGNRTLNTAGNTLAFRTGGVDEFLFTPNNGSTFPILKVYNVTYGGKLDLGYGYFQVGGGGLSFGNTNSGDITIFAGTQKAQIFGATGNLLIQTGGTFTDAGFKLDVQGTARVSGLLRGDADAQLRGLYPYLQFLPSGWSGGSTLIQAGVNLVGTTVGDYTLITTPANKGYAFYSGSTIPLLIETTTQNVVLNGLASSGYRLYINRGSSATGALAVVGGITDFAASTTSYASLQINAGVAPTSPVNGNIWATTTDLLARINGTTYSLINSGLSGSGAAGQVTFWDSPTNITGSNNLFWDSANSRLGIGTTTPTVALQVASDSIISGIRVGTGPGTGNVYIGLNIGGISTTNAQLMDDNVFIGRSAGSTFSGNSNGNVAIGALSLRGGGNVEYNTAVGFFSLQNFTGQYTTALGYNSGGNLTSGGFNTIIGYNTGLGITTGASNTIIGSQITGLASNLANTIAISDGSGTIRIYSPSTGNVLIQNGGTFTDGGQRLQVYGDAFVRGSGATFATTALLIQNSASTEILKLTNEGALYLGAASLRPQTSSTNLGVYLTGSSSFLIDGTNAITGANTSSFLITRPYLPTSGSVQHNAINVNLTINQTGGANGITRGLYVNPTLTAAADWRSIEWSNNSGWGLYGAGTAQNYFGGNMLFNANLNFTGANPVINMIGSAGNQTATIINDNGNGSRLVLSSANIILRDSNGIDKFRLYQTGNLVLQNGGTFADAGFRLDVNGTARVSGNTTFLGTIFGSNAGRLVIAAQNFAVNITSSNPTNGEGSLITTGAITTTDNQTKNVIEVNNAVTSTSASFNTLNGFAFTSTINQTLGIIRGLYINPTLTASTNFRAIEWSNNTGWGLYGAGTSLNYLGGSLGIKTTSPYAPSTFSLDVNGGLLVKNTAGTTAQITLINANPALGGNEGFIVHSVGGTSTSSFAQLQGYYGASISGSTALRLNPLGGNVIINSATNTGEQFQVNGTSRFSDKLSVIATATTNDVALFRSVEPYITIEAVGASNSASLFLNPSTSAQNGTIQNRTGGGLEFYVNANYTTAKMTIKGTTVNINSIPTSSAGLVSGDIWNDSGTLRIV